MEAKVPKKKHANCCMVMQLIAHALRTLFTGGHYQLLEPILRNDGNINNPFRVQEDGANGMNDSDQEGA
jgi:hypothetical protein